MTSFAFILGVAPLVWGSGPGYELRQALGTAVFYGMTGVTPFGLIYTPTSYVVCRTIGDRITTLSGSDRRSAARAPKRDEYGKRNRKRHAEGNDESRRVEVRGGRNI